MFGISFESEFTIVRVDPHHRIYYLAQVAYIHSCAFGETQRVSWTTRFNKAMKFPSERSAEAYRKKTLGSRPCRVQEEVVADWD